MRSLTQAACVLWLALPAAAGSADASGAARARVLLAEGAIVGALPADAPGAVFKGIPYAAAPVGPLRWRPPTPIPPWHAPRAATAFGPPCVQNGREGPTGSEDCLYLNVWTPAWPRGGAHPVMVWVHGGANVVGSANSPTFDGAALARRGVVVVTVNYRLGVMGFMAHPALSAESPHHASGNYTLLDLIAALRWVHTHIAAFGGDPRRVTLFGQSSGAYDVLLLMTSPLARGLFAGAIAQSGQLLSYDGPMPKSRAEALGSRIAAELQAPPGDAALGFLRSLPAERVVAVAAQWLPTALGSDTGLLTNVDGWVLPESPARVFAAGRQLPVPLIVGNNAREITPQAGAEELRRQITDFYAELAPQALDAYGLSQGGAGISDPLLGGAGAQWWTDIVQRCAASMEADWHAAARHPTWQYQFERAIPGREAAGSFHGAELAFVFGTLDRLSPLPAFTEADRLASQDMQAYWTRFASTGDPNGGSLPIWPRAGDGRYLAFTADGPVVKDHLQPGPCAVFRQRTLQRLAR